jgi:predicted nucleic acid-binding protein
VPRFFLDTNILIYQFDETAPAKAERATELVRTAIQTGEGIISYQVVQEFINAATRRFRVPMQLNDVRHCLSAFLRPLTAIESSPMLFVDALNILERHKFSWYDSIIIAAAAQGDCETLYSEDLHHGFQWGTTKVVNPFLNP